MGHMNVMWYVGKFDEASWNFLAHLHRRELLAGDIIEVRCRLIEMREKSVLFTSEMRNAETDAVAAECAFTGVHIDRRLRKACAFQLDIRARIEAVAGGESLSDAA